MSRKNALPSLERRVRRLAARLDLDMLKMQKPDKRVLAHGGYMLRDPKTFKIVFGDASYPYCADLDEVEAFLLLQLNGPTEAE